MFFGASAPSSVRLVLCLVAGAANLEFGDQAERLNLPGGEHLRPFAAVGVQRELDRGRSGVG